MLRYYRAYALGSWFSPYFVVFVALSIPALACTNENDESEPLVTFDSAGIHVHEIRGSVWDEGDTWTLSAEPTLEIGVLEGDRPYELYEVHSARMLSDGTVAVLNGGSSEVRLFDENGSFIRSIGGEGEGPGEFREARWMQVIPGDTILVLDWALMRLNTFTPRGELVRIESFTDILTFGDVETPVDIRMADGSLVIILDTADIYGRLRAGTIGVGDVTRSAAVLFRYTLQGEVDTLAIVPGIENAVVDYEGDGTTSTIYPPLGRLVSHTVADRSIFIGSQESYEIREYALDGSLVSLIRRPGIDLTITEADIEHFQAPMTDLANDDPDIRRANERYLSMTPMAPTRPAYGRLLLDTEGNLWISEWFNPLTNPTHWSVFAPGLGLLGDVELPETFRVFEIGSDYVLGRWTDPTDVEYVRKYRLVKE